MTTPRYRRLARRELPSDTPTLARWLIGKTLVRETPQGRTAGTIVETEAYVPGDAAAHAFIGRTARNNSLFLPRGHAYVYFIYGMHFSLNVAGERAGVGGGALIRALEPVEGVSLMQQRRGTQRLTDLTRGPGRVAQAMDIDRSLDGVDLCVRASGLWLADAVRAVGDVGTSVRIGISKEAERLLRFYERGNPHVSGTLKLRS